MLSLTWGKDLGSYLGRLWRLRYFLLSLVAVDLGSRYRRSVLGVGWSLIRPLALTVVFCLVFCNIFNIAAADYAPYVLVGLTVWQFLAEAAVSGCGSLIQGGPYIRQQPVPLALFPLRVVLAAGFHACLSLALAVAITWFFQGPHLTLALVSLLPTLVLLFLLGWCLAILGGVFNALFHDTQHLLEIFLQIFFYLTPIMYPPESIRQRQHFAWLLEMNPLTHVLDAVRQPVLYGAFPALETYGLFILLLAGVGILAMASLRWLERTLVFWL